MSSFSIWLTTFHKRLTSEFLVLRSAAAFSTHAASRAIFDERAFACPEKVRIHSLASAVSRSAQIESSKIAAAAAAADLPGENYWLSRATRTRWTY